VGRETSFRRGSDAVTNSLGQDELWAYLYAGFLVVCLYALKYFILRLAQSKPEAITLYVALALLSLPYIP
jgi:hypothetical protein